MGHEGRGRRCAGEGRRTETEEDGSKLASNASRTVKNPKRAQAMLAAEPAGWMETLGARITEAEPGRVVLELETGPQHRHGGGVVQGGVITQIQDAGMGTCLAMLQEDGLWN